jgi:Arc/MetJ family transcription regulator
VSYTHGMKTAISIPDELFAQADALARLLKTSRSELYARAVREYVARHASDDVTAALDRVCADVGPEDAVFATQASERVLERSPW